MTSSKIHYGIADLHIHTRASDGHYSPEKVVDHAERHTKLDIIAITDHDTIDGAKIARKYAKENGYRIQVVIGEEISTLEGHVIGLFLKKKIKSRQSLPDTLAEIHRQKGIAVMAHPLYHSRMKRKSGHIVDGVGLINLIKEKEFYDAIEAVNGTPTLGPINRRAQYLNRAALFKAEIGGSDAHILKGIGKGFTQFIGHTIEDLYQSITDKLTSAHKTKWEPHAIANYAIRFAPNGLKVLGYTAVHGRHPKRPQIVHCKL